jgi:hypothetical protein
MYIPDKFPCWRYHRTEAAQFCQTLADEAALGPGWADTPAAFAGEPKPAPAAEPEKPKRGNGKKKAE